MNGLEWEALDIFMRLCAAGVLGAAIDLGAYERAFDDADSDGIVDANDNCPAVPNPIRRRSSGCW